LEGNSENQVFRWKITGDFLPNPYFLAKKCYFQKVIGNLMNSDYGKKDKVEKCIILLSD